MSERDAIHPAWVELRHGGLLIAPSHLGTLFANPPTPLRADVLEVLRRVATRFEAGETGAPSTMLDATLQRVLGLGDALRPDTGRWERGAALGPEWTRRSVTGEAIKPRRVWFGAHGATLPLFWSDEPRLGVGRGRRAATRVIEWLRQRGDRLALLTNGKQWRLVHAALDHEAWVESDRDRWIEEGAEGLQVLALRVLLAPVALTPLAAGAASPLLAAIEASRRSQAELSSELGERVRAAVERLIREHGAALGDLLARDSGATPQHLYRAATRIVMRMVVVLFAEARDLLPRSEERYLGSYGLAALCEQLERAGAGGAGTVRAERLRHRYGAWPRVLALFRLVHAGSGHPGLKVPRYGGELFEAGAPDAAEPLARALHVFESAALIRGEMMSDLAVHEVLRLLTRSRVRVQAGRAATWVEGPVDFGDLSSEYIGILYEGLLDYELRRAGDGDPVVFLAVGDEPALPLSRLEHMEDAAIAELVKKANARSSAALGTDGGEDEDDAEDEAGPGDDEEEAADTADPGEEHVEAANEPPAQAVGAAGEDADTPREAARARVLAWGRRAVIAGKMVARPRSRDHEAQRRYEEEVARASERLVARIVLPGEWFLVRFGGTRKGSGTFYTRPQLAVPTVHRTLRHVAFDPPLGPDGAPHEDAPAAEWAPHLPEEILSLRVCDPACGSGSFPVAALRFLTEALFTSLVHHGWLMVNDGRLTLGPAQATRPEWLVESLSDALAGAEEAEELLKRRLRRVVVERCIYGVDLDPLAVELAKLALWVETLDRDLPFTFLDHKIRCGNSLVGCWFDRVRDFPALAWEREGGDKGHTRGTHYKKEEWTRAIKAQRARIKGDLPAHLRRSLSGQETLPGVLAAGAAEAVHDEALRVVERLHALPLHDSAERARLFREDFQGSEALHALRERMDLWCAQWFWPADLAETAPLPSEMAAPSGEAREIAHVLARELRFFHWELEFPDVFTGPEAGFDAVLGNPPWETQKPSSKEWFSNLDPLYRAYGKQEALDRQEQMFAASREVERAWLLYLARYKAMSGFVNHAAAPFGDSSEGECLSLGAGGDALHSSWRALRSRRSGYADREHPFRQQGSADLNSYKMFLELTHALLKPDGLLGLIVPSGLYTDKGTGDLRRLFLERCRWRWLFGFENRERIFDIHRSFKFGPVIVQKGGRTDAVRTAFMRHDLGDWEEAERHAIPYALAQVERFSPRTRAILEIRSRRDLEVLEKAYASGVLLGDESDDGWGIESGRDLHMTDDSALFRSVADWESRGYTANPYSRWVDVEGLTAVPLHQGIMLDAFNPRCMTWLRGSGVRAKWAEVQLEVEDVRPQFLVGWTEYLQARPSHRGWKLGYSRIRRTTDARTWIGSMLFDLPAGDSIFFLYSHPDRPDATLALSAICNSYVFDWTLRQRMGGTNVSWFFLSEIACPRWRIPITPLLVVPAARLTAHRKEDAPTWIALKSRSEPVLRSGWANLRAKTPHERLRLRAMLDAIVAALYGLSWDDFAWILRDCDHPLEQLSQKSFRRGLDPKGFWRVDQDKAPEQRHTVLSMVAFRDLERTIASCAGDRDRGIECFCAQNDSDGWMLPETLRLADLGLGHDDRARELQPVRPRMGERFLPWQLEQPVEESWAECAWHARNILGEAGFARLQAELHGEVVLEAAGVAAEPAPPDYRDAPGSQQRLFPGEPTLFGRPTEDPPKRRGSRRGK